MILIGNSSTDTTLSRYESSTHPGKWFLIQHDFFLPYPKMSKTSGEFNVVIDSLYGSQMHIFFYWWPLKTCIK